MGKYDRADSRKSILSLSSFNLSIKSLDNEQKNSLLLHLRFLQKDFVILFNVVLRV